MVAHSQHGRRIGKISGGIRTKAEFAQRQHLSPTCRLEFAHDRATERLASLESLQGPKGHEARLSRHIVLPTARRDGIALTHQEAIARIEFACSAV